MKGGGRREEHALPILGPWGLLQGLLAPGRQKRHRKSARQERSKKNSSASSSKLPFMPP